MAIINTLREKMGKLLVVVVGLSIMAFVLTDLLSNNSSLFGGNSQFVGEIDGQEISQEQFANIVDNLKRYYGLTSTDDGSMQFVREQAWNQLVRDIAFGNKLNELGLEIGTNERIDMVQGNNISPSMIQFFEQFVGATDQASIKQFLSQLPAYGQEAQFYFANAEQQAMIQRREQKFVNLLAKTSYATLEEAKRAYKAQFEISDVEYMYVPFASVSDEQIGEISDSEVRAYLSANEEQFSVEETRSVQYVRFPVVPSAEDSASYQAQMADIRSTLESSDNDSTYAISVTEQGIGFSTYDPSALPNAVADNLTTLKKGDIIGPDLQGGIYTIHKITDIVPTTDEFARVSQIVFNLAGKTTTDQQAVRKTANDVLRQLRNGESFDVLARQYSEGENSTAGGDFGWIKKGDTRIADIETEVFRRTRKGLIPRLIEKNNKVYIVNVTESKISNRYKVAQVIVEMTPSFETENQVYLEAAEFASASYGAKEFNNVAGENGYSVFSAADIDKNAATAGALANGRQVVSWLYGEASLGVVKDFDLGDEYVVALYDGQVDEGVQDIEDVRADIESLLREDKKAEFIKSKVASLSGSISEMATAYGEEAKVYNDNSVSLNSNSLLNVGTAPEAVGAALALQNAGDKSKPIVAEGLGVVVVQLKSRNTAAEIGDYSSYENQLITRAQNTVNSKLNQSVVDRVEVTDSRYKFY